jgi:hypothetical protein
MKRLETERVIGTASKKKPLKTGLLSVAEVAEKHHRPNNVTGQRRQNQDNAATKQRGYEQRSHGLIRPLRVSSEISTELLKKFSTREYFSILKIPALIRDMRKWRAESGISHLKKPNKKRA